MSLVMQILSTELHPSLAESRLSRHRLSCGHQPTHLRDPACSKLDLLQCCFDDTGVVALASSIG